MEFLILIFLSVVGQVWIAVPYGIAVGMNPLAVFTITVIFNFIPIPIILKLSKRLERGVIHRTLMWLRKRAEKWIEKYGFIGMIVSVSLASAYGAALAGYVLGVDKRKIYPGVFIGLLIEALFYVLASKGIINLII